MARKNYLDGGEAVVEACRRLGMPFIMSSPGSEWSPVWEAMARQTVEKNDGPRFMDCWHETIAVDIAMGYTSVTGKPLAVLLHAGVGLMHGSMAVLSAAQAEIPMLVMSGESTTFGANPEMPVEPQWYGGVSVGGAHRFVEPIVKWATQVTDPSTLYGTITRATEIAQRVPQGPVFISVSFEAMLREWKRPHALEDVPVPPKTQALPKDIAHVAELLKTARNPIVVVETAGRDPEAFHALVALSDAFAVPVINGRAAPYTNFPRSHPLWLGYGNYEHLRDADLILLVGGKVPWYPPSNRPGTGKIVSISENPHKMRLAYQSLSADLYLEGDIATALRLLTEAAAEGDAAASKYKQRRERWAEVHDKLLTTLADAEARARQSEGINAIVLAITTRDALPADTVYTDETITHMPQMRPHLPLDNAQSFFRVGAGGLGQGIAAALGVKLAMPERCVAFFVGDGSFLYNPIVQALAASKEFGLPIIMVICNNGKYESMRKGHIAYYEGGVTDVSKVHFGVNIAGFEYQELAAFHGFFGAKATTPHELRTAFQGAVQALAENRTAIINAVMVR